MAIDITSLSAKIRNRLNSDEDEKITPDEFTVVSETGGTPLQSSINTALKDSTQTKPAGLVKTVVGGIPKFIGDTVTAQIEKDKEFAATHTFGEEAYRDLVQKPAKILKVVGIDFPRMILGGLSSIGKTGLEAIYSPVFGKENVRESLKGDPKLDELFFKGETKSWQNIKEDIDDFTAESDIATDWEKQHLGVTLAVGGFMADAWVGSGKSVSQLTKQSLKELAKETDDVAIRSILTDLKMPDELIDDVASKIAVTSKTKEIDNIVTTSAKNILKAADEAGGSAVKVADDAVDLDSVAKQFEGTATVIDEPVKIFHGAGTDDDFVKIKKGDFDALLASDLKEASTGGNRLGLSTTVNREMAEDFAFSSRGKNVADLELKAGSKVLDLPAREIDDLTEAEVKKIAKEFDAIRDINDIGGEGEIRVLNKNALFDDVAVIDDELVKEARDAIKDGETLEDFADGVLTRGDVDSFDEVAEAWAKAETPVKVAQARKGVPQRELKPAAKVDPITKAKVAQVNNSKTFETPTSKPDNIKGKQEAIPKYHDERGKIAKSRDAVLEQVQDEMIRVRRLVENKGLKITEKSNPYDAELAFHGRVGARVEDLKLRTEKIDADIVKTAKSGKMSPEQMTKEVNEYLISRHAPERNKALGDGAAGITTAKAVARKAEIEALPHGKQVIRIADDIQKINDETLVILKEGEVITDDLYDLLQVKYKSHVPLQRVMEDVDDFAGAMAKGFDVKGSGIKTAKGSQREVDDILGNVVFNHEQALVRAEKNRVDLSTLKMVRDNKDALKGMFKIRKPKVVGETFSGKPITEMVTDPKILVLKEKGKTVLIEISDPAMASALRGVGREKFSGMMRGVAAITRFYSGVHTRFNPEFAFSNKVRDIQEVLVYAAAQEELGVKGATKVAAREARMQNVVAVTDLLRGKDSKGARLYQQMREDGGTTGGLGLSTRKQIEMDIDEIRKINRSKPHRAAQKTIEYVDNWNQVFEDSSRLSVYREALERGATRQRAAIMAKESSVNFNKFGKQGSIINAMWMFSNASIQGSTKMIRAMKDPKVAATVSTAVLGSVYAVSEWNDTIDPDWRNKIREWDRLNSMAIMLPSGGDQEDDKRGVVRSSGGVKYLTIPVSWGIKPIKVMADEMVDLAAGKSDGLGAASASVLTSVLEAYNPAGGTDVMAAITPTIIDIPVDVARNQAWHGGAIKPDWDRNAPASIQYFDSLRDSTTGRAAIGISKGLSGVGIEVSPASMHYGYEQVIGGVGRFVDKTFNTWGS
jgi:hypothetical protein